jgi:hypothetical protein
MFWLAQVGYTRLLHRARKALSMAATALGGIAPGWRLVEARRPLRDIAPLE